MNESSRGIGQVLAGAVLISFAAVFVKLTTVPAVISAFYRVGIGGVILLALAVLKRERLWMGSRPAVLALVAGVFFALDLAFWHRSIAYVGPGLATILANFQVFILAGFGVLVLHERGSWRLAAAVPLSMLGLFLLFGRDWSALSAGYRTGVGLALLAAVCYAGYLLLLRGSQRRVARLEPLSNLALICLVSAVLLAVAGWLQRESFSVPDWRNGVDLVSYAVVAQVVGWLLIARGVPHVPASRVGLILLLQPSLTFVWDVLFFHRPTDGLDVAGAVLALAAIYLGSNVRTPSTS